MTQMLPFGYILNIPHLADSVSIQDAALLGQSFQYGLESAAIQNAVSRPAVRPVSLLEIQHLRSCPRHAESELEFSS